MDNRNKIKSVIKDKSGRSMLYVTGVMFFIMVICASIAAAALNSVGSELRQLDYYQIRLLDESVQKNIMYNLQTGGADTNKLSYQFAKALYDARNSGGSLGDFELNIDLSYYDINNSDYKIESVWVSFPWQRVIIYDRIPTTYITRQDLVYSYYDELGVEIPVPDLYDEHGELLPNSRVYNDYGEVKPTAPEVFDRFGTSIIPETIPGVIVSENRVELQEELISDRIPRTAVIAANMTVTVQINAKGKIVTSKAGYEYINGVLADDPEGLYSQVRESEIPPENISDMYFTDDGYGEWRLLKYEIISS